MGYKSPLNMFPADRWRQNFFIGGGGLTYDGKVLGTSPIAYWPLWETSGLVANCLVNSAQNGTYTGVTLGQPGIGDGNTAPFFDGTNDFVSIFSAAFNLAFNGSEGTYAGWFKVANAGVWTDGTTRYTFVLLQDVTDRIYGSRIGGINNQINHIYAAGGVTKTRGVAGLSFINWMHWAITWSAAADEMKTYLNGIQQGATLNGLGVWAGGPLDPTQTLIGARTNAPATLWHGYAAHNAVWATALPQPTILSLATPTG
jgi:hypothetical protein